MSHQTHATHPPYSRDAATRQALEDLAVRSAKPLLLTGGTVITLDATLGDWHQADVLIGGATIVGVGPGLLTAADDDGMIVIDCAGTVILPSSFNCLAPSRHGPLVPG